MRARNPRAEAQALLAPGYEARVLEPSPPAVQDPRWYADDPTDPSGATGRVVSPTSDGDLTWDEYVRSHPEVAGFAGERWLLRRRPLPPMGDVAATRKSLHQVAFFAVAPLRYGRVGKLGLRWTHLGFGTPFFGADEQVRVEEHLLVVQRGDGATGQPITDLESACAFLGIPYREVWFEGFHDPPDPVGPRALLEVEGRAVAELADWFGFVTLVLEELRRTPGAEEVGRVQLWPEHFDVAVEMGSGGRRASFGGSPGDDAHQEPYLYVAPWEPVDRSDPFWGDPAFNGASLTHSELLSSPDPFRRALEFLLEGHRRTAAS
ncbi:MAG: hypothetical protein KatS3mg011_0590 [Acidimicrobiia bacterium]|nr:MAG: hypothetical protein KatS3mg011_0590 [Acidimicrobiia bacterium]